MQPRLKRTACALLLSGLTAMAAANPSLATGSKEQIRESYRTEITPLDKFDKNQFTLMVHAYNPFMAKGFVEQLKEKGTYDPKRDINLLNEPRKIEGERDGLS